MAEDVEELLEQRKRGDSEKKNTERELHLIWSCVCHFRFNKDVCSRVEVKSFLLQVLQMSGNQCDEHKVRVGVQTGAGK